MVSRYRNTAGQEWKQMVIPELMALYDGDRKGKTKELYSTLRGYLINNCSVSETAKAMQIHRNTLVYRLKKIEEELKMDLSREINRAYLMNCVFLLDGMAQDIIL